MCPKNYPVRSELYKRIILYNSQAEYLPIFARPPPHPAHPRPFSLSPDHKRQRTMKRPCTRTDENTERRGDTGRNAPHTKKLRSKPTVGEPAGEALRSKPCDRPPDYEETAVTRTIRRAGTGRVSPAMKKVARRPRNEGAVGGRLHFSCFFVSRVVKLSYSRIKKTAVSEPTPTTATTTRAIDTRSASKRL